MTFTCESLVGPFVQARRRFLRPELAASLSFVSRRSTMTRPSAPSSSPSAVRSASALALLARLLLPAAACLLGVFLGAALRPARVGLRGAAPAGDIGARVDTWMTAATTTITTATTAGDGVAHMRSPRTAAALAAIPAARSLGGGDSRLERTLLTAGSLPRLSAGVEVVAAAAAIPPHAHEVGEVLFFWRGAGGGPSGAAADAEDVASTAEHPAPVPAGNMREPGAAPEPEDGEPARTAVATVGGRDFALADGDVLIIPAGVEHTVVAAAGTELWLVWVLGERDFAFRSTYDAPQSAKYDE